jgi:hypothetical protein
MTKEKVLEAIADQDEAILAIQKARKLRAKIVLTKRYDYQE